MSALEEKPVSDCPACGQHGFVPHCPSPTCNWMSCRNKPCELVLDLKTQRGHVVDPANRSLRRRWKKAS